MPCREGPGDPAWLKLTNGERAMVFFLAAFMSDDSLDRKLYLGTAWGYANGVYGDARSMATVPSPSTGFHEGGFRHG